MIELRTRPTSGCERQARIWSNGEQKQSLKAITIEFLRVLSVGGFVIADGSTYLQGQRLDTSHMAKGPTQGWSIHDDLEASLSRDSLLFSYAHSKLEVKELNELFFSN